MSLIEARFRVGAPIMLHVDNDNTPRASGPEAVRSERRTASSEVVLVATSIRKAFGAGDVLAGVSLSLRAGEVVALAGENGAGKSTFLKILAGLLAQDSGEVVIGGADGAQEDGQRAGRSRVSIIPQELAPVLDLAVYENIFLGRELHDRWGMLDRKRMIVDAARILREMKLDLDPVVPLRRLSTASQQMIEIVKNSSAGSRILLLDEPTSAINQQEVEYLYRVIAELQDQGVAMIYTTHKIPEMRSVADRVVVLRDGSVVTDAPIHEISDTEVVRAMIGHDLGHLYPPIVEVQREDAVLVVEDLKMAPGDEPISFTVRRGEIVALAGLRGSGCTEAIEGIFGIRPRHSGRVSVDGTFLPSGKPAASVKAGMGLVPEDRKIGGAVLGMSVFANGMLPRLKAFSRAGWIQRANAEPCVQEAMGAVQLRCDSLEQEVGRLSGGNQQKVVIGRWLTGGTKVLLLDEPTRGVDVGARGEIYKVISHLAAANGLAILIASSDMSEVVGLANRILVMRDGAVVEELRNSEAAKETQESVLRLATGLSHQGGAA